MISIPGWETLFEDEDIKDSIKEIFELLDEEEKKGYRIVPDRENIFKAFELISLNEVNVVLYGMDPYPSIRDNGKCVATGLSFSVDKDNDKIPGSLKNIFKEIKNEFNSKDHKNGNLDYLCYQGVLLLNSSLTTRAGETGSHCGKFKLWDGFIDKVIQVLNDNNDKIIHIFLGNDAKKLKNKIKKGFIIEGVHPSPLSANRGFFGSGIFIKVNKILEELGKDTIEW